jgi:hypothetical protein
MTLAARARKQIRLTFEMGKGYVGAKLRLRKPASIAAAFAERPPPYPTDGLSH